MDINSGEDHIREEARVWRERAERLQAENAKLRELVFELLETDNEFLTDWEIEARKILGV